jgi:hypothetical protein
MSGNVWEWCLDDWHKDYKGAPVDGSRWGDGSGEYRVNRGGGWSTGVKSCRSALRFACKPSYIDFFSRFPCRPGTSKVKSFFSTFFDCKSGWIMVVETSTTFRSCQSSGCGLIFNEYTRFTVTHL